jgi:hypothetical protein
MEHRDIEKLKKLTRSGLGTWREGKPKGASRSVVVKGNLWEISRLRIDRELLRVPQEAGH